MWEETKIEKLFKQKILKQKDELQNHTKYSANYDFVKENLCTNLYSNIKIKEPNLTDHGEDHIKNVLQNAYSLVDEKSFTGVELYVLCMAILIHDIGNLNGRDGHERTLKKYFNKDKFDSIDNTHITMISLIASKHGGKDCDAIGKLNLNGNLDGKNIRQAEIASLLRFADEIAEGKQRTSDIFFEDNDLIPEDSKIYHYYAKVLEQPIVDGNSIRLDFNIKLLDVEDIEKLIIEIFRRINKLNDERIYCSHYNNDIYKIKKVAINLAFYKNNDTFTSIESKGGLFNFELSGRYIHCDNKAEGKQESQIKKILELI